jgi:hypothetical protein
MGIMIAGLAVLVHGEINGIGNERMIRESIMTVGYMMALAACEYLYLKIKKIDIVFEINKNSISSLKYQEI